MWPLPTPCLPCPPPPHPPGRAPLRASQVLHSGRLLIGELTTARPFSAAEPELAVLLATAGDEAVADAVMARAAGGDTTVCAQFVGMSPEVRTWW